ncbi:RE1 [Symbiodinium sp. KB8]|nr:RE1 [Symbiodinium sp. KB8]
MAQEPKEDFSRLRCAWDGEPSTWMDFARRVRLAFERTARRKRHLLGPEVVSQLSGRAWTITQDIEHARLVRRDGVIYLLTFLREHLGRLPIPDIGLRLEALLLRTRRQQGQSMATWSSSLRQQYRLLQIALVRVRGSENPRSKDGKPAGLLSEPSSSSSPRRRASGTMEEEPQAEEQPTEQRDETETVGPGADDEEEELADASSPSWRRKRRDRRDSDSDSSLKAVEDLQLWEQQEESLPEVLPPEVLGWLLLRRSNLSQQERLSVQAAARNSLKVDDIERALRSMEDELSMDPHRAAARRDPRRRTYWMEEDGQWSLLLGDPEDLDEIAESGSTMFVGDRLPSQVYQDPSAIAWYQGQDDWNASADDSSWWGESSWDEASWWSDPLELDALSMEEQKEVDEAFAVAEQKARTFVQARQAVKARNLSRGFYSYNPGSKSGSFKGKGKGKGKSKGHGKNRPHAPPMPTTFAASSEDPQGFLGAAVGDPSYTGCFICGDKSHDFRSCPKRSTARAGKGSRGGHVHFVDAQVFHVAEACIRNDCKEIMAIEAIDVTPASSGIFQTTAEDPRIVPDNELAGYAVIDSGATETVASLPALEALMSLRSRLKGYAEPVVVTDIPAKRFKFGNGEHAYSSSFILLPQTVGEQAVQLGVFTMDVTGVPLLLGIKSLRRLKAVLDFDRCVAVFAAVDAGLAIHLKRSRSGHMLIDLKGDWLAEGTRLDNLPQQISNLCFAEENLVEDQMRGILGARELHAMELTSQLSYTPRAGAHAMYRKSAPLASDVTEAHKDIPEDAAAEDFPANRDISLAAAEVSARNQLEKIQALRKGAAPKAKSKAVVPKEKPKEPEASTSSSPLSPGTILIEDTPVPEHPGRKATRTNEILAENLEYAEIESMAQLLIREEKYDYASAEKFLMCLHPRTRTPSRAAMKGCGTSSYSVTFGLYAHGNMSGVTRATRLYPVMCQYLNGCLKQWRPDSSTRWTSISLSLNTQAQLHIDAHNQDESQNMTCTLGPFDKGELWLEAVEGEIDPPGKVVWESRQTGTRVPGHLYSTWRRPLLFSPKRYHRTRAWKGDRIALTAFTARSLRGLDPDDRAALRKVGFPVPGNPRPILAETSLKVEENDLQSEIEVKLSEEDYEAICTPLKNALDGLDEIFVSYPSVTCRDVLHVCDPWIQAEQLEPAMICSGLATTYAGFKENCDLGTHAGFLQAQEIAQEAQYRWLVVHVPRGPQELFPSDQGGDPRPAHRARRYLKLVRHLLLLSQKALQLGTQVLWIMQPASQVLFLSEVRHFWKELQKLMDSVRQLHRRFGHPSNRLLIKNLQARGADQKVIAAVSQLRCDECLEGRIKLPSPSVNLERCDRLWACLQVDGFDFKYNDRYHHFVLMVDEASGYAVVREAYSTPEDTGRNLTTQELMDILEEAWYQYFGFPEQLKMDLEGAHRGKLLRESCMQRGIELIAAPAQHHESIAEVERSIGILRGKMENFLRASPTTPKQAALAMVAAHNSLAKQVRLEAEKAFLDSRHREAATRAKNMRVRSVTQFLPGDLVFYRRYRHPADLSANQAVDHPRMKIARWFGPARVLACETKVDGAQRRPSAYVWAVSGGRIKKFHMNQLRHASESERLVAEATSIASLPWTFTSLQKLMGKGTYDDESQPPRRPWSSRRKLKRPREPRNLPPEHREEVEPEHVREARSDEEMVPHVPSAERKRDRSQDEGGSEPDDLDIDRLLHDVEYLPPREPPALPPELPRDFRQQRMANEREERPWHVQHGDAHLVNENPREPHKPLIRGEDTLLSVVIDVPPDPQSWKKILRNPGKFLAKSVQKGVEVSYHKLNETQRRAMDEAKMAEVQAWVASKVAKAAEAKVSMDEALRMRWVYTFKAVTDDPSKIKAKARIVVLGFSDPALLERETSSPALTRTSKMLLLNLAVARRWRIMAGDVRTAFLQAKSQDRVHPLYARPLPELAEAFGLPVGQMIELLGSAYGLTSAPREWYMDLSATLRNLGAEVCVTDPCLWRVIAENGDVVGVLGIHVDDILMAGNEQEKQWVEFLHRLHGSYQWAPWETDQFTHCGLGLQQLYDDSVMISHEEYCSNISQIDARAKGDDEPLREDELSQLRAVHGAIQWRVTQSAPHHAAKLSYLQSFLATKDHKAIELTNKLVREVHSSRHLSVGVHQLDFPAEKLVMIGWSDAAVANRPDGSSTGGHIFGLMRPSDVERGCGKVNIVGWKSGRLQRVARSSLAAETQALADLEQELMFARLTWAELIGERVKLEQTLPAIRKVPAVLITDARALFDALEKGSIASSGYSMKDKYTALEMQALSQHVQEQGSILQWVDSDHQLADGLTKLQKQDVLKKFLAQGTWRLRMDGALLSAKKRRALLSLESSTAQRHD